MDTDNQFLIFVTKNGLIKRTPLNCFENIRSNGLIATRLAEDDELRFVQTGTKDSSVMIASNWGRVIRYNIDRLIPRGRAAMGQRGIILPKDGEVVGMVVLPQGVESDEIDDSDALPENDFQEKKSVASSNRSLQGLHVLMVTEMGKGKLTDIKDFSANRNPGKGYIGIKLIAKDRLVNLKLISSESGPQELILASKQGNGNCRRLWLIEF